MISLFKSIHIKSVQRGVSVLAFLSLCLVSQAYGAKDDLIPVRLVTIMTLDDQGNEFGFPYELAYDPVNRETFLVSGAGRITVYDSKYFPVGSFGKGRGMVAPQGLALDRKGNIYVCQGNSERDAVVTPRLTIYNPAFFISREIIFSEIPELKTFTARRVAVSSEGLIYLIGETRENDSYDGSGAVVLSPEGQFLRRITPRDKVFRAKDKSSDVSSGNKKTVAGAADKGAVEGDGPGIAEGLRPAAAARDRDDDEDEDQEAPVYLFDVVIDDNGRIYLLSREVSHVYVYNAKEEFLFKFGEKGGVERKLSNPTSLAVDFLRRTLYVVDYMRHTILCYEYDTGKYIFEFGGRGFGPLWFNFPNHIEVDSEGQVVVADLFNRRVQVIDPNIRARRPLLGRISPEMAAGAPPAPDAKIAPSEKVQEPEPESEAAEPLKPAAVAPVSAAMATPAVVTVPVIPVQLAGITALPDTLMPEVRKVPKRPKPASPKLIRPDKFKKAAEPKPVVVVRQPVVPEVMPQPEPVVAVPEKDALVSTAEPSPVQRVLRLPASLGVYGPVAALGLLGGWFLYRNR